MYRNWKRAAALGLTVLLACMMPAGKMLAADHAETGTGSVSDNDAAYDGENASDTENVPDEGSAPGGEGVSDEGNAPGDEAVSDREKEPDTESVPDEGSTPGEGDVSNEGNAPEGGDVPDTEDSGSVSAPEIMIKRGGENAACPLGGEMTFEYVNNRGTLFEVYVEQIDESVSVYCYIDKVTDMKAGAKKEEVMDSLYWGWKLSMPASIEPLNDGCYVLYIKVEAGDRKYYARSNGVVVDTKPPVITGVEEGNSYPEGTVFQVEDANLDIVLVNGQPAVSENGNYKVSADGTSCVIRAKDKAGNETVCSITVSGNETPDTGSVICESGVYELKAGVKYHLAQGNWKVDGDRSVYQGGNDFYVAADGSYKFTK